MVHTVEASTSTAPVIVAPKPPEWTFDTLIVHLAKKYGQSEILARKIIKCESSYKQGNVHYNRRDDGTVWSTDWGYFQVNDYWHRDSRFDFKNNWQENLEYGFLLLKEDGAMAHWSASAYCWNT